MANAFERPPNQRNEESLLVHIAVTKTKTESFANLAMAGKVRDH